ncbi:MAG: YdcH family protein [Roseinatronobacter sp.]
MSHTPHELGEEFPDAISLMQRLKLDDAHFARLADEYHEINRAIHRAETLVEPVAEHVESDMRRTRMALKDQIARMISANTVKSGCTCGNPDGCCGN